MAKKIFEGVKSNRDSWLDVRNKSLGSSDAPTVCDLNPFKPKIKLWLEKRGLTEPFEGNDATYWGTKLEPIVAQEAVEALRKQGHSVDLIDPDAVFAHDKHPFITATPDFFLNVNGELAILECKTTSAHNAKAWAEGPPDYAHIQALHQLEVIDQAKYAIVAGLILTPAFKIYRVDRSDDVQTAVRDKEVEFWGQVESATLPPVTKYSDEILKALYPRSNGEEILLPLESEALLDKYLQAKAARISAEKEEEGIENEIKALVGHAKRAKVSRYNVSWSDVAAERFDSKSFQKDHHDLYRRYLKQSSYRRFLVTQEKEKEDGEGQY